MVPILLLALHPVQAQDSVQHSPFEKAAWVVGSSLVLSLGDYVAYNIWRDHINWKPNLHAPFLFRFVQGSLQAAVTYFLYKEFGINTAISFNLLWWTWFDDLLFYGWGEVINPAAPWPNRENTRLTNDSHITWAGWTPVGLLRKQGNPIAANTLVAQTAVGFSISMELLW
jgi:hypothetical protein